MEFILIVLAVLFYFVFNLIQDKIYEHTGWAPNGSRYYDFVMPTILMILTIINIRIKGIQWQIYGLYAFVVYYFIFGVWSSIINRIDPYKFNVGKIFYIIMIIFSIICLLSSLILLLTF